ncbi:hypothetical protein K1719_022699 [Acacia pycnantha]|nr:hypothetical protein K1719_022699 [Acacia pycnantha]
MSFYIQNALQSMMEEKLPGCGIKACPHITSKIKTLKRLWQTAYDMMYETNTSAVGWDPDTKCITAEKEVWNEYIKAHSRAAQFRTKSFPYFDSLSMVWEACGVEVKSKDPNWYDNYKEAAKWKHGIKAKEAKKKQRAAGKKGDATVSQKRKAPPQVDPDSAAPSPPKDKKQKAKQVKQGKKKIVVSDSSSSDDKGWKPTKLGNGSSDTNKDDEENVGVDKTRAKLYKKLRVKQRENVAPEPKGDFNQSKLEDYDIIEDGVAALGALFGQVLDVKLSLMKAELQALIEAQHISAATSPKAGSKKDEGQQDSTQSSYHSPTMMEEELADDVHQFLIYDKPIVDDDDLSEDSTGEEGQESQHVDEVNSVDKSAHSEDDDATNLTDDTI